MEGGRVAKCTPSLYQFSPLRGGVFFSLQERRMDIGIHTRYETKTKHGASGVKVFLGGE